MNKSKIVSMLLLSLLSVGCDSKKSVPPLPSVVAENPVTLPITPYLIETGNLVASSSIDLVARVSGTLDSYHFTDGSLVKKGDLLFVIQPQPYADQVVEAQATLDSDTAAYVYDKIEYERQLKMYKKHATPLAEVQQWSATTDEAAAAVESAKANLENAKITYSYTHILAPMDGRIGRHLVDPGNLVGNGEATALASLQQLDIMYVYFTINELDVLKLREVAHKMSFDPAHINEIPIEVALQNETGFPHKGFLDFAASELDASTGTIQMRGILDNQDYSLLPGLFVQARIALSKPTPQLTIPSSAVMYDQIGAYVYTVDAKNKVSNVHIQTSSTEGDRIVVTQGLHAEDRVIVNGVQNASPGVTVTLMEQKSS